MAPRTLQRRLALLVEQKRLVADGRGKGRRCRVPPGAIVVRAKPAEVATARHPAEVENYLPVSSQAKSLKAAVRAPIQER